MRKKSKFVSGSFILFIGLIVGSWIYLHVSRPDLWSVFNSRNKDFLFRFIRQLFGEGAPRIAYGDKGSWQEVLKLSYQTVLTSILAIGFAAIGVLLTVIPAASNIADGRLTLKKTWYGKLIFYIIRLAYIFSRAVPELVWAMLIVFVLRPGILPGAVALGIHNFGSLGKLCAEVVEDVDPASIQNLSNSGASSNQILLYGVIPSCFQKFLYYTLYRFEVIARSTIVVGAVGAGGLGEYFRISMSHMDYTAVTLAIICYLFIVYATDFISGRLQKLV